MKLIKLTDLINGKIFKKQKINKLYNLWTRLQMGETGLIKEKRFYGDELSEREKQKLAEIMLEIGEVNKTGKPHIIHKRENFFMSFEINFIEKLLNQKIQELKNSL